MMFDIVICLGPNDRDKIQTNIEYNKRNIIGYRNIYIISYDKDIQIDGCITIDEKAFKFNEMIQDYFGNNDRNGWYLQQLLKLYAHTMIQDALDYYLVIDADTIFLKPTSFFENDTPLYSYGDEYHYVYFIHMQQLHPILTKQDPQKSGICNHMLFNKTILTELFDLVEKNHNQQFYKVFIENIDKTQGAGASEYELYFNFMIAKNKPMKIRKLNYCNYANYQEFEKYTTTSYDYVSCHWYLYK